MSNFFKKAWKKTVKANKYLLGGGAVKDLVDKGARVVKKNPFLATAATTLTGAPPGLSGLFGFGGDTGQPPAPPPPQDEFESPLPPGLLIAGAVAVVALVVFTQKGK